MAAAAFAASKFRPKFCSAFVLERLKQDAERRLGPISQAVITVPAFFDETRRKATQDAGRLVGLDVLDIINEPTAAAVAYGHLHGRFRNGLADSDSNPMRILVYDLGGGTFDVTILELAGTQFRTLATDGDVLLGGKDFDERLVNYVAEQFLAAQGIDPRSDPQDAAQLRIRCPGRETHALGAVEGHRCMHPRRRSHENRSDEGAIRGSYPRPC